MTRRNVELVLLLVAAPVVALLFAMIAINQGQSLDMTTLGVPAAIFVASSSRTSPCASSPPTRPGPAAPLVRAVRNRHRVRHQPGAQPGRRPGDVVVRGRSVHGAGAGVRAQPRQGGELQVHAHDRGFLLLLSPLVPGLGQEIYGSRIWLHIGSYSFQPGEIAKIVIVLFLAGYLAQNREMLSVFTWRVGPFRLPDIRTLLPLLLMWGIALVIVVFEKDLGSALVFFFVFLVMAVRGYGKEVLPGHRFGSHRHRRHRRVHGFGHVQVRVNTWLDPFADPLGDGHQTIQSLYGHRLRRGHRASVWGKAARSHLFVPEPQNDFIFSIVCEELGFVGACAVVGLFVLLLCRGITIAARAPDRFGALLVVGFVVQVALQAVLNVAVVTNTIPNTGISLPFFSSGGTSLMMLLGEMGVVLGVSRGEA